MVEKKAKLETTKIKVMLEGVAPFLFNKFIDHSKEVRPVEQKFYIDTDGSLVLPSENIDAFLWGKDPRGCAKVIEGVKSDDYLKVGMGHVFVDPILIPFLDEKEKPIMVPKNIAKDKRFGIVMSGGRTRASSGSNSIKQEAQPRPYLKTPWLLIFTLTLIKNKQFDVVKLDNWFNEGGLTVALGAWRTKFGRFMVKEWKVV